MVSIFGKEWDKATARGDIEQYIRGVKCISENWVIGHLRFAMRFSEVTKDFLFQIMSEVETSHIYKPLQTLERMIKLKKLRTRIEKEL